MTPEEIAGCFLHYQDYFNGIQRRVAVAGLTRLLNNPADPKAMSMITVSSAPDYGVLHEGYHKAAEAYKEASSEKQAQVKKLMETGEKQKLIEKIEHFMTPDPDRAESESKKEKARKDLEDYRESLKQSKADAARTPHDQASATESAAAGLQTATPMQSASQKPSGFTRMFESFSFEKAYREAEKLSLAQKLHLHNYVREEQVQLLDTIEKFLLDDDMANDAEHAQIFHGVLHLIQDNLQKEFRWTKLLGCPTKSRLDEIIQGHITNLSAEFPEIQKGSTKESLIKLVQDKNLSGLDKKIDQLLKPHGFLDAVREFIKHGLNSFQAPKPKP